jgi:hypothetical protein
MVTAALVGGLLLVHQERAMEPARDSSGTDIVAFEFAGMPERAREILDEWGAEGRAGATRAIKIDYAFLIAYAVFLSLAVGSLAAGVGKRTRAWAESLGWGLAGMVLVAGALDAIENTALLRVLDTHRSGGISGLATLTAAAAASVKFLIVAGAVMYLVIGSISLLISSLRVPSQEPRSKIQCQKVPLCPAEASSRRGHFTWGGTASPHMGRGKDASKPSIYPTAGGSAAGARGPCAGSCVRRWRNVYGRRHFDL